MTITDWQRFLARYVDDGIVLDGQWGPHTRQATIVAQGMLGVPADGIVGPRTEAAAIAYVAMHAHEIDTSTSSHGDVGVDSYGPVTQLKFDHLNRVGVRPAFWGRYAGDIKTPEVELLNANGCRLLPIAQQSRFGTFSSLCGRDAGLARSMAMSQVDYLDGLGVQSGLVFADVEQAPIINPSFVSRWCKTMTTSGYTPALYFPNRLHSSQWSQLQKVDPGAVKALWLAMYVSPSDGSAGFRDLTWEHKWSDGKPCTGTPAFGWLSEVPIVAWQSIGNAYNQMVDFNVINPQHREWFLNNLPGVT